MSKEVLSRITESISNRVTEAMEDPAHKDLPTANLAVVIATIAAFECASQLLGEIEQRDQRFRSQASRIAKLEAALTREGISYE